MKLAHSIVAALLAVGCAPAPQRPNIVWVVWDTARADHLSLYGYDKPTTPFLDQWARDARVFEDCTSASSWTVPSHASMFTGLLPAEHGAQHEHEYLDEELTTIAELLRASGYQTFAWTANPHLSDEENFLQGFDVRKHPWDEDQIERARSILQRKLGAHVPKQLAQRQERNESAPWIVKAAGELGRETWLDWLKQRDSERPFFAFFNYMEAHRPLIPPRALRERMMLPADVEASFETEIDWTETWGYCFGLQEIDARELELSKGTYDAALLELDGLFAELMRSLDEQGLTEDTLVVLTSDHGEHLGEHHLLDHQYSLSQILIHVPLVVRFPGKLAAGRDARPVMSLDLFPTLLELAGVEAPPAGVGFARSLLDPASRRARLADYSAPYARPLQSMRNAHPEHDIARFERGQFTLIDAPWKLVQEIGGPARLYDVSKDPGELHDLALEQPEVRKRLAKDLAGVIARLRPLGDQDGTPHERSPALLEMLRELGYAEAAQD